MEKILEELSNMEKIAERIKKNQERELKIKEVKKAKEKLHERVNLTMFGTKDREVAQEQYDTLESQYNEILEAKKVVDDEIRTDFDKQKQKIIDQIDKRTSDIVKTKQDRENAEKARDAEIKRLEGIKKVYAKIAENSKKDIDNILEKLSENVFSDTSRLSQARSEYKANKEHIISTEKKIEELQSQQFESIEENREMFTDLAYLKKRVLGMNIEDAYKIKSDSFIEKYGKPEQAKEETKEPENKESEDKKPEDKKPEDKKPEDKKPEDKKPEDKKPEDKKPENNEPTTKDGLGKNVKIGENITVKPSKHSIKVGNDITLTYRNRKDRNNDKKRLTDYYQINKYFGNKKNIDFSLLSTLDGINKGVAIHYLNILSGGAMLGDNRKDESLEKLNKALNIEYNFDKTLGLFRDLKMKRIAREAHKLGFAELSGIKEKSLFERIKDRTASRKKALNKKEQPKALTSGKAKDKATPKVELTKAQNDKEKVLGLIEKDRETAKNVYPSYVRKNVSVDEATKRKIDEVSKKYSAEEKAAEAQRQSDVNDIMKKDTNNKPHKLTEDEVEIVK